MTTHDRKAKAQAAGKAAAGGGANVIVVAGIVVVLAIALIVGGVIWSARDTGSGTAGGASQLPAGVAKAPPIAPVAAVTPVPIWASLALLGSDSSPFGPIWVHLGLIRAHLGPFWAQLSPQGDRSEGSQVQVQFFYQILGMCFV